jgi:hypothetical protein
MSPKSRNLAQLVFLETLRSILSKLFFFQLLLVMDNPWCPQACDCLSPISTLDSIWPFTVTPSSLSPY